MSNLPNEIIIDEILPRLPVKSLCRFKCVSKPWQNLFSHPGFIKFQMNQTPKRRLIIAGRRFLFSVDFEQFDNGNGDMEVTQLDSPSKSTDMVTIVGSFNGLVCIKPKPHNFLLYNPCTGEFNNITKLISDPPGVNSPFVPRENMYGFGYAPAVDDYRCAKISEGIISVYSLKTSSLTGRPQTFPYNPPIHFVLGTPLNGAIHWVVSRRGDENHKCVIIAFNLVEETFTELPEPDDVTGYFFQFTIGVMDGCICLMHFGNSTSHNEFWIMREYGVKASWIRIEMTFSYETLSPLCLMKNGKALLVIDQRRLALCNLENGMCEDIVDCFGFPPYLLSSAVYVESLVSPYLGNGV